MTQALVTLLIVALLAPAFAADFDAGMKAYNRGDYEAALREWRPLAEQGHASAQNSLGSMYAFGEGVPQDDAEAAKWYRLAAEQGYARAQAALGPMYVSGRGVPQDDAEAVKWFRLAAEQGNAWAQNNLGFMYTNGRGVPQDDAQAYAWFNVAAAQGKTGAAENRDRVAGRLTPEARNRAQKLAREYWEAYVVPFRD